MTRQASKSEALSALRQMFGPTTRLQRIDRAGVTGVRVLIGSGVAFQTFDMAGDVWRRCVRAVMPLYLHREARRCEC